MTTTPRGIRNNNPGNIRNSERNDWAGEVSKADKKDNAFEEFELSLIHISEPTRP